MLLCRVKGHAGVKGPYLKGEQQRDWQLPTNIDCSCTHAQCKFKVRYNVHVYNHTQYPQCISKGHTSTVLHKQSDSPVCEVFFGTATYNSHIPFHFVSSFHTSRRRKVMCTRTHMHTMSTGAHISADCRGQLHILMVVGGAAARQRKFFANVLCGRKCSPHVC